MPGLGEAATGWLADLPAEREREARRAAQWARPSLHPQGLLRAADVGGRTALAAMLWATADRATNVVRRAVYGERSELAGSAIRRAQQIVRTGGPTYVKLGQFIATARGILPDDLVDAFAWCRDEVPPLPRGTAPKVVARALGAPIDQLFAAFDDEPMAAASVAQVHLARLHDGTEVVVKVRRPGLHHLFEADIRALAIAAALAERQLQTARLANLSGFVALFAQLCSEELDFRLEALNMVEVGLAAEDAGVGFVRCPRPVPGMVTPRVLVMERLPGVRYTDAGPTLHRDVDRARLLRLAIQAVIEHTVVYGRFHGDLHAGNVLIDSDGSFSLVDFGIVGRLTAEQRDALVRVLVGVATRNLPLQLGGLVDFGAVPADVDVGTLTAELAAAQPADGSLPTTPRQLAEALGRVIRILIRHGFRLPPTLILFFKNLVYLNGFAAAVAPDANLLAEMEPIFRYFQTRYGGQMSAIVGQ